MGGLNFGLKWHVFQIAKRRFKVVFEYLPPPRGKVDRSVATVKMMLDFFILEMMPTQIGEAIHTYCLAPSTNLRAEDIPDPHPDLLPAILSAFLAPVVDSIRTPHTPLPSSLPTSAASWGGVFAGMLSADGV
uniref:Uncharacterized protein n=1 Tax=Oryza sativa subsp. japonica TaxID=39947 RepID=Q6H4A5_ORYSJ|nr:hypothetical protein [Oryza sativa Japonica Group]BAD26444.1 hypothetical protein [Oryza sativa Japonica Group]